MTTSASRREFLKITSSMSAMGAAAPMALNLAAMSEASAATATGYKAIVCIFLYGGNDQTNTLVPYDLDNYRVYKEFRPITGYDRQELHKTALGVDAGGGFQYALAPGMSALKPVFDQGDLRVLLNIGSLVEPVSKNAYVKRAAKLPPKLFSHNDQQAYWQSFEADNGMGIPGWGGRVADQLMASNGQSLLTCINCFGSPSFPTGLNASAYRLAPSGPIKVKGIKSRLAGSMACSEALHSIMTNTPSNHLMMKELNRIATRSINLEGVVADALAASTVTTEFPEDNPLAEQLKAVSRMISVAPSLGLKRQVFMVGMGGFDSHNNLATNHPVLIKKVADAMAAFHQSNRKMGIADSVVSFTASEFGRSWGDADGSDHGWGGNQFVMGTSLTGSRFVGVPAILGDDGPNDVGQGRQLPTRSTEQLAATLGRWMGVSNRDLLDFMPNLSNFNSRDLGFLGNNS